MFHQNLSNFYDSLHKMADYKSKKSLLMAKTKRNRFNAVFQTIRYV